MGTYAYMPPEQALGDVDRLDERADVFAKQCLEIELGLKSISFTVKEPIGLEYKGHRLTKTFEPDLGCFLGMSSDVGSGYAQNGRSMIAKCASNPQLMRNVPNPACVGDGLPAAG